jgi:hypothetical protein
VDRNPDEATFLQSSEQHPRADLLRAQHTVTKFVTAIFGQDGDPSSTSMAEALMINCWSSMPLEGQVVRPRPSSGSQGLDLLTGVERSSSPHSELGGNALSSPAFYGGSTVVLDCFFFLSFRVLFVKWRASSSNVRFLRARYDKGSFCNCTCHLVIYKSSTGIF